MRIDGIMQEKTNKFQNISASDMLSNKSSPNAASANTTFTMPTLSKYALWIEPRDVWCVKLDPIWIEFLGVRSVGQNKAVPFVDAVPITFWIHGRSNAKLNVSHFIKVICGIFCN